MESICRTCLAIDRNLQSPEPCKSTLDLLAPDIYCSLPLAVLICWECRALLRRAQIFAARASHCASLLQQAWRQACARQEPLELESFENKSLSSLIYSFNTMKINYVPSLNNYSDDFIKQNEDEEFTKQNISQAEEHKCELDLLLNIKSECSFDVDDDIPLINHKKKTKRKSKRKNPLELDIDDDRGEGVTADVGNENDNFISNSHHFSNQNDFNGQNDVAGQKNEFISMDDIIPVTENKADIAIKKKRRKYVKREETKKSLLSEVVPPQSSRYRAVLVSAEEQAAWRAADARAERYTTLRLPHKCTTCLLPFRWPEQLATHHHKKHNPSIGDYVCDICCCRFATPDEHSAHRELHFTLYECLHCEHTTRDKKGIDKHYEMAHSEARYPCGICDQTFKTFLKRRYHRDAAHRPLWPCQHCDKTFRLRGSLHAHMRIHQQLPKAECPLCGKTFKNKYSLVYHLRIHEESSACHYCQACNIYFKTSNLLRLHMKTSMKHIDPDQLKYACDVCGRRFVNDKRRAHHYDSVHLNKTEFACTECSKAYANRQSLRSHVQRKHKQAVMPRDKICDICGKGFHNNVLLKNHMRTHTGERPFHCKLCPSTFSYSAALYTHNRLVHLKLKRNNPKKKSEDSCTSKRPLESQTFIYSHVPRDELSTVHDTFET